MRITLTMKDDTNAVTMIVGMLNQKNSEELMIGPENLILASTLKAPPAPVAGCRHDGLGADLLEYLDQLGGHGEKERGTHY